MKKNPILTSIFVLAIATPAMATTTETTFPNAANGEYMQPDTIYKDAANETNMASVDGTEGNSIVNAEPQYASCSSSYSKTEEGTEYLDMCYRECSRGDIPNMALDATITGHYYRGSLANGAINACVPSKCDSGYVNVNTDFYEKFINKTAFGYTGQGENGQIYQDPNSQSSVNGGPIFVYGDHSNGDWSVVFGDSANSWNEQLFGSSYCTAESNTLPETSGAESGPNCYCYITGYKPKADGQVYSVRSLRVFLGNAGSIGGYSCPNNCAFSCAGALAARSGIGSPDFKELLYKYAYVTNKCVKNNNDITIIWTGVKKGVDGVVVADGKTNSVVRYGGDVQTPEQPLSVLGKVFKGWKFTKLSAGASPIICPQTYIATIGDPDVYVNVTANTIQLVAPAGATSVDDCTCPSGFTNEYIEKTSSGSFTGAYANTTNVNNLVCYVRTYDPGND